MIRLTTGALLSLALPTAAVMTAPDEPAAAPGAAADIVPGPRP